MFFNLNKYRRRYTAVILASYLVLVSISILHYHNIDIQAGNYAITSGGSRTASDPFDKMDDITHECTLQHFANTIINYNFITIFDIIKETAEVNFAFKEILKLPGAPLDYNNPLRAPPLFS